MTLTPEGRERATTSSMPSGQEYVVCRRQVNRHDVQVEHEYVTYPLGPDL